MSRRLEKKASRIDYVMAVGLRMGQVSISGGRKATPVSTTPVEPVEAGNQRLWRAMMWKRKYADDEQFRNGIPMNSLPNIDVYEVSLEWVPVNAVSNVEDVEKTTNMKLVIQSCVETFGNSGKKAQYYSTSLLVSNNQPVGFPPTAFIRLYPDGPQHETLSQWYLNKSLELIKYAPPSKELHIAPPKQLSTVTNDEFYNMTFHWNAELGIPLGNLKDIATAVRSQKVLGSDETCILKTYESTNDFHSLGFWEDLPRSSMIGHGSYNNVYLLETIPETLRGFVTKSIVIREARSGRTYKFPVNGVLKEMYLTGYASHYELGPKLLASYYLATNSRTHFSDVDKTVSASVAWDGDCHRLLTKVAPLTTDGENRLPPDFCKTFGNLFVDLAKRAADVGFFHADIKPANMLYSVNGDLRDTLKLCMTDFDPSFCHLLPPKDRECAKDCIISATVLMFLAEVRCHYGDETWIALRDGMLQPFTSAIQPKDKCRDEHKPICKYLQYTLVIEARSMETKIENTKTELRNAAQKLKNLYIVIYRNALRRDNSQNIKDATAAWQGVEIKLRSIKIQNFATIVSTLLQDDTTAIDLITDGAELVTSAKKVAEALTRDNAIKSKLMKAFKSVERFYNRVGWLEYRRNILSDMTSAMQNKARGDFALDYDGQKLEASQKWQRHIAHYITSPKPFSEPCLQVKEEVSLFDQVFDYAIKYEPSVRPNGESTKRKLDDVTNPTNPTNPEPRERSATLDMDQDVTRSMAAVHSESLNTAVLLFYDKLPDQSYEVEFYEVETAMETIINEVNGSNESLTYIVQLHDDNSSPAFRIALTNLNKLIMDQKSEDWVGMQKKVVKFLYEVFIDGLHGVVDESEAFKALGSIEYLYANLDRFADRKNIKSEFTDKARKLADAIRPYSLSVAVPSSSY